MGIFRKVVDAFRGAPAAADEQAQLASVSTDVRLHARYEIPGRTYAWLRLSDGTVAQVRNISYGGLAAQMSGRSVESPLPDAVHGVLTLLDQSVECRLAPVRSLRPRDDVMFVGMVFQHENPKSLLFIRDAIEPMRCARSLVAVPEAVRHQRFKEPAWQCYRGDGPIDLVMRVAGNSAGLAEALLTFRQGEAYCEVAWRGGQLHTGRAAVSQSGTALLPVSGNITPAATPDPTVVRHAIYILLGSDASLQGTAKPLLDALLSTLRITLPTL